MSPAVVLAAAGLLASAALTRLAIAYAWRRRMLDQPGARRSHDRPTPRGGGIAPLLVILGGGCWLAWDAADMSLAACVGGLAAVAAIGWIDDHRPLPFAPRLLVHAIAALVAWLALAGWPHTGMGWAIAATAAFAVAGLVNAWNFMDGIDGLATSQAGLVVVTLLAGGWMSGDWNAWCVLAAAAIAGFLPFNAPRARIFLGDVGSGAIGYLVAALSLHAIRSGGMPWTLALLPPSAFLVDAAMTLLSRILRGKRWWRPHREHLYQWLVRSGRSHATVTGWYAIWTAIASVSALWASYRPSGVGSVLTITEIVSGLFLWFWLRRRLWTEALTRR